jgi:hypothetical protein
LSSKPFGELVASQVGSARRVKPLFHPEGDTEPGKILYSLNNGSASPSLKPSSPTFASCYWCGRTITDPDSVRRGLGPDCFSYLQGVKRKLSTMTATNQAYWQNTFSRLGRRGVKLEA